MPLPAPARRPPNAHIIFPPSTHLPSARPRERLRWDELHPSPIPTFTQTTKPLPPNGTNQTFSISSMTTKS